MLRSHPVVNIYNNRVEHHDHLASKLTAHLQISQHETTAMIVHDQWTSLPIRLGGGVNPNWDFSPIAHGNLAIDDFDVLWKGCRRLSVLGCVFTHSIDGTLLVKWHDLSKRGDGFQSLD